MKSEVLVPGGCGRATKMWAGSLIEIVNVHGQQICDFVAYNEHDLQEHLSPTHTRSTLQRINLKVGDRLYSNLRNPLFELVEDTVGQNDLLFAACDYGRYEMDFGIREHRNCRANLVDALREYGVTYATVPDPINWFQNTPVMPDGTFGSYVSPSESGDRVVLRALVDSIVAASACPQDQIPVNNWHPTDLCLVVRDPDSQAGEV